MQGRGLKLKDWAYANGYQEVAPRAGAWIETIKDVDIGGKMESPLVQGRGLKRQPRLLQTNGRSVAPRAGAWIETAIPSMS